MKAETISGVYATRGLAHWRRMLNEWVVVIEDYGKFTEDKAYYYTERTNVGMLVSAIAKTGGLALEEFQSIKRGKDKKEKSVGRADLWVRCKPRGENEEYVEAKFHWLHLKPYKPFKITIQEQLNAAIEDAKRTRARQRDMPCVGLAFLPTYIPKSKAEDLTETIKSALQEIKKEKSKFDAMAWCFPASDQVVVGRKGNVIPGVILLAKLI